MLFMLAGILGLISPKTLITPIRVLLFFLVIVWAVVIWFLVRRAVLHLQSRTYRVAQEHLEIDSQVFGWKRTVRYAWNDISYASRTFTGGRLGRHIHDVVIKVDAKSRTLEVDLLEKDAERVADFILQQLP